MRVEVTPFSRTDDGAPCLGCEPRPVPIPRDITTTPAAAAPPAPGWFPTLRVSRLAGARWGPAPRPRRAGSPRDEARSLATGPRRPYGKKRGDLDRKRSRGQPTDAAPVIADAAG